MRDVDALDAADFLVLRSATERATSSRSRGMDMSRSNRLIKSAKAKGLLAAHDERMTQAIEGIMQWVAADRSEKGDSHKADKAAKEDAWFIVHVVGALIVRLVGANGR